MTSHDGRSSRGPQIHSGAPVDPEAPWIDDDLETRTQANSEVERWRRLSTRGAPRGDATVEQPLDLNSDERAVLATLRSVEARLPADSVIVTDTVEHRLDDTQVTSPGLVAAPADAAPRVPLHQAALPTLRGAFSEEVPLDAAGVTAKLPAIGARDWRPSPLPPGPPRDEPTPTALMQPTPRPEAARFSPNERAWLRVAFLGFIVFVGLVAFALALR